MRFLAGLAIPLAAAAMFIGGWVGARMTVDPPAPSCTVNVAQTHTSITLSGRRYLAQCTSALDFWKGSTLGQPYSRVVCIGHIHGLAYSVTESRPDRWAAMECLITKEPTQA